MEDTDVIFKSYITTFIVVLTILKFLARIVKIIFTNAKIRIILLELLSTIEICVTSYMIIPIMKNSSPIIYILYLCIATFIWKIFWLEIESTPNIILEYMLVQKNIRSCGICIICVQIFGDYLTFKIFQPLLNTDDKKLIDCPNIFDENYVVDAFIFEWLLTMIYRLSFYGLAQINKYLPKIYVSIMGTLMLTICKTLGFIFIGSFNNPVIGAFLRYNCLGIDKYHILLVYWAAPFCGSLSALFILYLWKQWMFYTDYKPRKKIHLTIHDISTNSASLYMQQTNITEFNLKYSIRVDFQPHIL